MEGIQQGGAMMTMAPESPDNHSSRTHCETGNSSMSRTSKEGNIATAGAWLAVRSWSREKESKSPIILPTAPPRTAKARQFFTEQPSLSPPRSWSSACKNVAPCGSSGNARRVQISTREIWSRSSLGWKSKSPSARSDPTSSLATERASRE